MTPFDFEPRRPPQIVSLDDEPLPAWVDRLCRVASAAALSVVPGLLFTLFYTGWRPW